MGCAFARRCRRARLEDLAVDPSRTPSRKKEFFVLLAAGGAQKNSRQDFAAELKRLRDEFVKSCVANAAVLHTFIFSRREAKESYDAKPRLDEVLSADLKATEGKIIKTVEQEARKTRRTVKATAKKAVEDIRTRTQSDYDKRITACPCGVRTAERSETRIGAKRK